jgi:hypothetical protein
MLHVHIGIERLRGKGWETIAIHDLTYVTPYICFFTSVHYYT